MTQAPSDARNSSAPASATAPQPDARTRTYQWEDPMAGAAQALQMDGLDYIQAIFDGRLPAPPIAQTLGYRGVEASYGRAVFEVEPAEYHYNPIGVVHGGLAATLLDSALGVAVHTTIKQGMAYTTVELHINYVRPLTRTTGTVRAEANIIHSGRQIATAEGKLVDANGKLYAHGTTTCLVFPIDSGR